MWLILMLFLSIFSTLAWYLWDDGRYRTEVLALVSWGTTIMVFADHLMSYFTDGVFLEVSVDALLLGFVLVAFALLIWLGALLVSDPMGKIRKTRAPQ